MTICVTGHRTGPKLGGYDNVVVRCNIHMNLFGWISRLYQEGHRTFISGGATGIDQWFAIEVIQHREIHPDTELILAAPFPSQPVKWPADIRNLYYHICSRANKYYYVSPDPYAPWKMQKRNEWMVDMSTKVLAVWDGSSGGTANCINYALSKGKNVIRLFPFSKEYILMGG